MEASEFAAKRLLFANEPEKFNRFNDAFFKFLFAKNDHKPLLIDLLNAIFDDLCPAGIKGRITDLTIGNVELTTEHLEEKTGILDIKVTTNNGEIIDVEVQTYPEVDLGDRDLFYFSKVFSAQKEKGNDYSNFKPVVIINLLAFLFFNDREQYHSCYEVRERTLHDLLTEKMSIHFIEAPKCKKAKEVNRLVRWIQYLTFSDPVKIKEFAQTDPIFADVMEAEKMFMSNQDEMDAYISAENAKFRLANLLKGERSSGHAEGLEEGIAKGRAEGLEEGHAKGLEEGIAKGRAEVLEEARADKRETVISIARKMLASGMSKESVQQFTSLSDAEMAAL